MTRRTYHTRERITVGDYTLHLSATRTGSRWKVAIYRGETAINQKPVTCKTKDDAIAAGKFRVKMLEGA